MSQIGIKVSFLCNIKTKHLKKESNEKGIISINELEYEG